MNSWLIFVLLAIAGYLVGSIPLSYLAAKGRGVDMRKEGTHQVGAGNLWRTTSRKLGLFVGIYDFFKGMLMVLFAYLTDMEVGLQLLVGIAVIIGHNWPVFLKFHGGRGIATALGLIIFVPSLNTGISTWPLLIFFGVAVAALVVMHRTPVPILFGLVAMPVTAAIIGEPITITLGYTALVLIIIIKRLTAQPNTDIAKGDMGRVYLNRLLFDRDIRDRGAWVHRKNADDDDLGV